MAESTTKTRNSVLQLLVIAALMVIGYACIHTLRSTVGAFNFFFVCGFYVIPFFSIRPILRLSLRPRIFGLILLSPFLLLSSFLLLFHIVSVGPGWATEFTQSLQTFQQGSCTVELERYASGGAVGIHGLNLEQRRLIFPGFYLVKSVDTFDSAWEGTLSVEGPYKVRVHAKGNYSSNDYQVDKVYDLKPWIYF
jgi:hypothetical protein